MARRSLIPSLKSSTSFGSVKWSDGPACSACNAVFGMLKRKHHCRACGGVFCSSCSSKTLVLPHEGPSPVRVCDSCFAFLSSSTASTVNLPGGGGTSARDNNNGQPILDFASASDDSKPTPSEPRPIFGSPSSSSSSVLAEQADDMPKVTWFANPNPYAPSPSSSPMEPSFLERELDKKEDRKGGDTQQHQAEDISKSRDDRSQEAQQTTTPTSPTERKTEPQKQSPTKRREREQEEQDKENRKETEEHNRTLDEGNDKEQNKDDDANNNNKSSPSKQRDDDKTNGASSDKNPNAVQETPHSDGDYVKHDEREEEAKGGDDADRPNNDHKSTTTTAAAAKTSPSNHSDTKKSHAKRLSTSASLYPDDLLVVDNEVDDDDATVDSPSATTQHSRQSPHKSGAASANKQASNQSHNAGNGNSANGGQTRWTMEWAARAGHELAASVWSGVQDAMKVAEFVRTMRHSNTARRRTKDCVILNGFLFLATYLLYVRFYQPHVHRSLHWKEHEPVVGFVAVFLEYALYAIFWGLWLLPLYVLSVILNAHWYDAIAFRSYRFYMHRLKKNVQHDKKSIAVIIGESVYRNLVFGAFLMLSFIGYCIPIVGGPLYFLCLCCIYSVYCFEYKWNNQSWGLERKLKFFERRWLYFIGFGTPITLISFFWDYMISYAIISLLFPVYIPIALYGRPTRQSVWRPIPMSRFVDNSILTPGIIFLKSWFSPAPKARRAPAAAVATASSSPKTTPTTGTTGSGKGKRSSKKED